MAALLTMITTTATVVAATRGPDHAGRSPLQLTSAASDDAPAAEASPDSRSLAPEAASPAKPPARPKTSASRAPADKSDRTSATDPNTGLSTLPGVASSPSAETEHIALTVTPSRSTAPAGTAIDFTVRYTLAGDRLLVVNTGNGYLLAGCGNDSIEPRLVRHQRSGSTHTLTLRWSFAQAGHYLVAARVFSDCTLAHALATDEAPVTIR